MSVTRESPTTSEIRGAFIPRQRPSVATVEVDDEAVLYDEASERLHVLNPTAAVIWSCCDGTLTVDELVGALAEAYGTDEVSITADVHAVLASFADEGLLDGVAARADRR